MTSARNDEGFSLLEVLFAAFIAFFVLTAIYGVIVMSASEGRIASSDVVSTNLAQLVVEQARALPYESVGVTPTPDGQVSGVLPVSEDTTYQGTGFTIKREVYWVADPLNPRGSGTDYKRLVVSVSWKGGHATPVATFIRDHANETPTPPTVAWKAGGLPANSVLFTKDGTTQIWDHSSDPNGTTGGLASLQASASIVATSTTITRIELLCNGLLLASDAPNVASVYAWPNPAYSINLALTTDTPTPYTPVFKEGVNTIKVLATASNLGYAYTILLVTVDNHPPDFQPGDVVKLTTPDNNQDKYASSLSMAWTVPMDGTDPPAAYDMVLSPPSAYATTTVSYPGISLPKNGASTLASGAPVGFTPLPGMPYQVSLVPRSVRGLFGRSATSGYACTSPRLNGKVANLATQSIVNNNFEFRLNLTHAYDAAILAAFPGAQSIQYDVYSVNAATYQYPGSGNLSTATAGFVQRRPWDGVSAFSADVGTNSDSCNEYLQVDAKVMKADGTTVITDIWSNVVGPPLDATGQYAPPAKGKPGKPSVPVDVTIP